MSRFCIVESFSLSCIPEATERLINEKVCLRCAFSDLTTRKKIVKETETFIRDFPCYCLRVNWMWWSMKNRAWCIFQNMKCVSWLKALHQLGSESLGSTSKWLKTWAVCRKDWASIKWRGILRGARLSITAYYCSILGSNATSIWPPMVSLNLFLIMF